MAPPPVVLVINMSGGPVYPLPGSNIKMLSKDLLLLTIAVAIAVLPPEGAEDIATVGEVKSNPSFVIEIF